MRLYVIRRSGFEGYCRLTCMMDVKWWLVGIMQYVYLFIQILAAGVLQQINVSVLA